MKKKLIKIAVRARFVLTSRNQASNQIRKVLGKYRSLAQLIGPEAGRRAVRVPPMLGVDEDMRDWSFFMILEHNVIVNQRITRIVDHLMRGETPAGMTAVDMKKSVMPSSAPGEEQIQALRTSVEKQIQIVSHRSNLRTTATTRHPLFGDLNAHGWHCMFGLHLDIHRRQAEAVLRTISQGPAGDGG